MSKDDIEKFALKKFWQSSFEELWKELKTKNLRTRMITKTTRKYVAQYFFLAGLNVGMQLSNAKLTEIIFWGITLSNEPAQRLRKRFLDYAHRLRKENPALADKIEKKVDDLVAWYIEHRRDMTPEEIDRIIGKEATP